MSCWKYVDLGHKKSFLYVGLCRFGIAVFLRVVLWQQACCSVAEMFEFNSVKFNALLQLRRSSVKSDDGSQTLTRYPTTLFKATNTAL